MNMSARRSDEWNEMEATIAAQVEELKAKRSAAYEKLQVSLQALIDVANAELQRHPIQVRSTHDSATAEPRMNA
jgi:uncharacterized protein YutE (UPF0331/DUF86 family)